ncbi:MAG: site-specific DNA-methyltransferase [Candidatus Gastranaerophilales bacterium]|nr:site-specific DNA-methyltransferase [Candidatus Gastranaerophilales bacterium]
MPTLEWIGKEKVINHHQDVPFRVLERKYSFDEKGQHKADNGSENMIIRGDNLEALKALLPRYEGKVKCIYIDPPYNTGNETWVYNDNVNDPKIKKWLGEVVGKEGEDLSRHDKWLCMMYPRLRILQKLLTNDGALVISIGQQEISNLLLLCKEIFASKQITCVTVQTSGGKPSGGFNFQHEYLVFIVPPDFSSNPLLYFGGISRTPFEGLTLATFDKTQRPNQTYPIFIDASNGNLVDIGMSLQERIKTGEYTGEAKDFKFDYTEAPKGTVAIWPMTNKGNECVWRLIPSRLKNDWGKGYIKVSLNKDKKSLNKFSIQYLPEGVIKKIENGVLKITGTEPNKPTLILDNNQTVGSEIPTILIEKNFYTVKGTTLLENILDKKEFNYPKPLELIMEVLRGISSSGDIILDSFAGSGTTAHAVLNLNKQDDTNRKFILVEMEDYAEKTTSERVKRVISGYEYTGKQEIEIFSQKLTVSNLKDGVKLLDEAQSIVDEHKTEFYKIGKPIIKDDSLKVIGTKIFKERMDGTGGNFSFYELGERLLLENGNLNEKVGIDKIREYVWFMETKSAFPDDSEKSGKYFLGTSNETSYYFYYEQGRATTLNHAFLKTVKVKAAGYVIYADINTLSAAEMNKYGIVFKKIPRDIAKL